MAKRRKENMTPLARQLKAEVEELKRANNAANRDRDAVKSELDALKETKKKNWDAIIYCENCQEVNLVSIPPSGMALKDGDCVTCRHRGGIHLVRKVNCDRT